MTRPPIQKNGIDENTTSSGAIGYPTSRLHEWRTTVPCVWIAPLGSEVLPELYTITSGSAGTTHSSTRARNVVVDAGALAGVDDRSFVARATRNGRTAPHTWTARRNGASGSEQRAGRPIWPARPGQRRFEAFEVVVVEEARVHDQVR